ncbi:TetR/AcrR family transcriptional regulator [Nocardioides caldifontis]|uniref:TetR/AcrR family transcriptional regulator n=1 Tax=Nocardioides caldifontis TaxID=2588938 RepID=UPI0011DF8CBE|nr:TetR/AcrR family transcriptional regulator [Nocardioides caldifontis]
MSATRIRLSPESRREQLLDLGVTLLSGRRLEDLSIDVLADEAGISRGLLYHYFAGKREFHLAVLRRMADQVVAITAPPSDGDPLSQLVTSLAAYLDFVTENRVAYVSFVRAAAAGDEEFRRIYEEARGALTDRIFDHAGRDVLAGLGLVDGPELRLLVRGWSAMVEDTVLSWLDDDRGIARDALLEMVAATLVGVAGVVKPTR